MRILIVHNLLWAHYKSSVFQALQHLVSQQADTSLLVLQIARNERSRAGLDMDTTQLVPTYSYPYTLLFDRYLEDVPLLQRTRVLLRETRAFKPDVINLTGYYDPAQLALLLWAKATGVRVVMQNESTAADQTRGGWKESLKRWIISRCDGFFCFGNQAADYLIQLGVPPARILLRKNAVDNNALRQAYERALPSRPHRQQELGLPPNNVVFVGRLIAVKNLPMLLTCFAEAIQQSANGANWGLILLGDGTQKDALSDQITALNLTGRVTLMPGRPWYRVPEVLALSNVLVLPSRSEPWGLVVNEAMACGLPVIVSDRCGCAADLVRDGQNGFVIDPARPAQLTHRLVQFIEGTADAQQMGLAAQATIAPYSPEAVAREMLNGFVNITK